MDKNELITLYKNPFYDDVFQAYDIPPIPSKKGGYKKTEHGSYNDKPPTPSVAEFERWMRNEYFEHRNPVWPLEGDLFVYITILIIQKRYSEIDIDNLAHAMLDAMKGIVYLDDVQVSTLLARTFLCVKYTITKPFITNW